EHRGRPQRSWHECPVRVCLAAIYPSAPLPKRQPLRFALERQKLTNEIGGGVTEDHLNEAHFCSPRPGPQDRADASGRASLPNELAQGQARGAPQAALASYTFTTSMGRSSIAFVPACTAR